MFMIIAYHYVVHGQSELLETGTWSQRVFLECFSMFGKIGANIYVLITGYFNIKRNFRTEQVVRIEFQTLFYSIGSLIIMSLCCGISLGKIAAIKSLFPVVFNDYWYITAYMILYLLSPWLNKLLLSLSKDELKKMIIALVIIWSVLPCITLYTQTGLNWSQQIWMFVVYIVGAYIGLYDCERIKYVKILSFAFSLLLLLSVVLIEVIAIKIPRVQSYAIYFRWSNTLLAFPCSVLIFLLFRNMKLGSIKWINSLASASLSVYLLHENKYFRVFLWKCVCINNLSFLNLVFSSFLIVPFVYILGCVTHLAWNIIESKLDRPISYLSSLIHSIYV